MRTFESTSADGAWKKAFAALRACRESTPSRAGHTVELLHCALEIRDPRQRWVESRSPAVNVAFAIAEVIGILNGRRDSDYLTFFNRNLPAFAGQGPTFHGAYGYRLRRESGIDQLLRAYEILSTNRDSRQVVLQIWDPILDLPCSDGSPRSPDIPCNISSLLKVRNGKLHWMQIMRSNDVFRGLPYNIVQFTTLHEVVAGWLCLDLGSYCLAVDSLHLYTNDLESGVGVTKVRSLKNHDALGLPKSESDELWGLMNERLNCLIDSQNCCKSLKELYTLPHTGLQNLMKILAAEAARRSGKLSIAREIVNSCTNKLLARMWVRWADERRLAK